MKNVFDKAVCDELASRINNLSADAKPLWGKMSVGQMLAHCSVTYEYLFEPTKYKKPSGFVKLMLKLFVKSLVVGDKPYKKSSQTAPDFIIKGDKNLEEEKARIISFIYQVQALGAQHFDGKESHSFGKLTTQELNTMFYKHLDYHLGQFGV
jgi:uncharacterized damage-inducible protein DinB